MSLSTIKKSHKVSSRLSNKIKLSTRPSIATTSSIYFEVKARDYYYEFKDSILEELSYLKKPICLYGEECKRKNPDHKKDFTHINYDDKYKKIKDKQYETAKKFTDFIFNEFHIRYSSNFSLIIDFFRNITSSINDTSYYHLPDLPNFAILISVMKYTEHYKSIYGLSFLCDFIFLMEQEGVTAIYDYKIKKTTNRFSNFKSIFTDFKSQFSDIYKKFEDAGVFSNINERDKTLSNTNVLMYLKCKNEDFYPIEKLIDQPIDEFEDLFTKYSDKESSGGKKTRKLKKNNKKIIKVPMRYLPKHLSKKDKAKQKKMLNKSRKLYKKGIYFTREKVKSFKSKKSDHVKNAEKLYNVDSLSINNKLAKATQCSKQGLKQIVKKGEGAYYSSGSRPNQSPASWGYARLGSAITGSKSAIYDYNILENHCKKSSKALKLAKKAFKKYKNSTVKKIKLN